MSSRREFIKRSGTVAATGSAGIVGFAAVASAAHAFDEQPDYVTIGYDESELKRYQPYFVTRTLDDKPSEVYAWKVRNTERDTDIYAYWLYWPYQEGINDADSHKHDREPVYVEVSKDTGDVENVIVDGYHYITKQYPEIPLYDSTHPKIHIVADYHFFRATEEEGEYLSFSDFTDEDNGYPSWLHEDWDVHQRSVEDPHSVKSRGHLWDDTAGVSANQIYYSAMLNLSESTGFDVAGASASDV